MRMFVFLNVFQFVQLMPIWDFKTSLMIYALVWNIQFTQITIPLNVTMLVHGNSIISPWV